jgi:hypothetical protein
MKRALSILILFFWAHAISAQELFPVAEPASNIPKGALGIRMFGSGYKEAGIFRSLSGIRLLYGLTPKLSVYATATFSDYHGKSLPFDFISHHSSGPQNDTAGTLKQGVANPYLFNSLHAYAKYRFFTSDGEHMHLRMTAYAEGAYVVVPSHNAEPDLLVHTSGWGAGLITTYLKRHFATSLTVGFIMPSQYKGNTYDKYGGVYPVTIQYGNAVNYSLSFGYLLFPKNYKSYKQVNWNIYCEFFGRYYGNASVTEQYGPFSGAIVYNVPVTTPALKAGQYLDAIPGIQCIINSTYRVDASVALPLVSRTYGHLYPFYMLGVQRYFYFNKRAAPKN